jgi:hypothetical protein
MNMTFRKQADLHHKLIVLHFAWVKAFILRRPEHSKIWRCDIFNFNLNLPKLAIASGTSAILVLNEGWPRLIKDIVTRLPAVVQFYHPAS